MWTLTPKLTSRVKWKVCQLTISFAVKPSIVNRYICILKHAWNLFLQIVHVYCASPCCSIHQDKFFIRSLLISYFMLVQYWLRYVMGYTILNESLSLLYIMCSISQDTFPTGYKAACIEMDRVSFTMVAASTRTGSMASHLFTSIASKMASWRTGTGSWRESCTKRTSRSSGYWSTALDTCRIPTPVRDCLTGTLPLLLHVIYHKYHCMCFTAICLRHHI